MVRSKVAGFWAICTTTYIHGDTGLDAQRHAHYTHIHTRAHTHAHIHTHRMGNKALAPSPRATDEIWGSGERLGRPPAWTRVVAWKGCGCGPGYGVER